MEEDWRAELRKMARWRTTEGESEIVWKKLEYIDRTH
jgi:hypothetical protein